MILTDRLKRANWRLVSATLCAVAVLHLSTTLLAPGIASAPAFRRLSRVLPVNAMLILPPVTADAQPLPFMAPDAQFAMCRFDTSQGTVAITATLPGPGWTLALHSTEGDNFYTAVAQPGRKTQVSLLLIPTDERFTGLTPEAKGKESVESVSLTLVARQGIAVLRAPDMGISYRAQNLSDLGKARCSLRQI